MPVKKKAAAKKSTAKGKKPAAKKGASASMDAASFVDRIHTDKKFRAHLKKGWDAIIKEGKKQGYKFSKQQLHDHLKKKYNITKLPQQDEPDTCICI